MRSLRSHVVLVCAEIKNVLFILAAMSGVFLGNLTLLRSLVSIGIGATLALIAVFHVQPSPLSVGMLFAVLYLLRYALLFWSFGPRGVARGLRARFGDDGGFARYEALTAIAFAARGVSFGWLIARFGAEPHTTLEWSIVALGYALAAIGTIINVWATRVVGIDTYYYRDLFLESDHGEFKITGPYRYMRNPMYGPGQLAGYGAALAALSPLGVIATVLNQVTMYAFNWLVERPHVRRMENMRQQAIVAAGALPQTSSTSR